jgi:hypothetical protein
VQIEITDEQCSELALLLEGALGELSHEIAGTDNATFRQGLRVRQKVLHALLDEAQRAAETPRITFTDRHGTTHSLTLTGDEATGTVWIPASLVHDNSDTLGWIADLNLLSAEDPEGGPAVYGVRRSEWTANGLATPTATAPS